MAIPTTYLIDALGRPRGVNLGAVRALNLLAQLRTLLRSADGPVGVPPILTADSDTPKVNVE